jgi:hypothetical protein
MADRVAAIGKKPAEPRKTQDAAVNAVRDMEYKRELKAYEERLATYQEEQAEKKRKQQAGYNADAKRLRAEARGGTTIATPATAAAATAEAATAEAATAEAATAEAATAEAATAEAATAVAATVQWELRRVLDDHYERERRRVAALTAAVG